MREQEWPLAPAYEGVSSVEQSNQELYRRRGMIFWSCALTMLIMGLITLILAFTVFKVKRPTLTINTVAIQGLEVVVRQGPIPNPEPIPNPGSPIPKPGLNLTFISDISIKNPNSASFKFTNVTTWLYYGELTIGEVKSPPGNMGAYRTIHMDVTMDVMVDTIARVSRFPRDVIAGEMPIGIYTNIHGRANMMNIIKKHIDVKLDCTMTVMIETHSIKDKVCERTVHM